MNGIPNNLNNKCIPCSPGTTYSSTENRCVCAAANFYVFNGFCYNSSTFVNPTSGTNADRLLRQHVNNT